MYAEGRYRTGFAMCLALAGVALLPAIRTGADCGSIPYQSPLGGVLEAAEDLTKRASSDEVAFDPLDVVVYEPGQRAIILWNGKRELLLLSTDIKTSEDVSILEVIPLPAEPTVTLGDFETFEKMRALVTEKQMWAVAAQGGVNDARPSVAKAATITFHRKMGAHDVAVVKVLEKEHFVEWVQQFLAAKQAVNPRIRPEFTDIIENYLARGFNWFVFDTIQATDRLQSRQPVQYIFDADAVFYPLEISSLENGRTTIDLTVVTQSELTSYPQIRFASRDESGLEITAAELDGVSRGWAGFMRARDCTVQCLKVKGNIRKLKTDFVAR
ncbi:MAG TPA: DUF2330 domain-containing protein [Candidatus Hydrogenedentes bacterium]|nr:DUF2330 domain-containing protein [Candidatus Hydrogenedentota bacterium]